jgi:hypothetical protein
MDSYTQTVFSDNSTNIMSFGIAEQTQKAMFSRRVVTNTDGSMLGALSVLLNRPPLSIPVQINSYLMKNEGSVSELFSSYGKTVGEYLHRPTPPFLLYLALICTGHHGIVYGKLFQLSIHQDQAQVGAHSKSAGCIAVHISPCASLPLLVEHDDHTSHPNCWSWSQ